MLCRARPGVFLAERFCNQQNPQGENEAKTTPGPFSAPLARDLLRPLARPIRPRYNTIEFARVLQNYISADVFFGRLDAWTIAWWLGQG